MTAHRSRTGALRYLLPSLGALLTGMLGIAAYTARRLNAPRRRLFTDIYSFSPWEVEVPHEPVEFTTDDGVVLRGWWLPKADATGVVIGLAGHRREKHELLGIASGLWRDGQNVLLFDFRGVGDSQPAPQSLAYHEVLDAKAAVDFASRRLPGASIGLIGYSMGAAIAILAAAADARVRAVVVDSPFAGMREVVSHAYRRNRVPSFPLVHLADAWNRARYGYSFAAVRPIDVVGQIAPRPILIIHGTDDVVTPLEHAYRLFEAAGEPKELWVLPGTGHVGAYFQDRALYVSRVAEFFARGFTAGGRAAVESAE